MSIIAVEEIGAFSAKTRLSELLRETEKGRSFLITRRGKVVARLVPPEPEHGPDAAVVIGALREIRSRVKGKIKIRQWIEEGRRY